MPGKAEVGGDGMVRAAEQAEAAGKHELNADREVRGGEGERR